MDEIGFLCASLGSSTVQLHDSLRSWRACACSEDGFSSQYVDRAWGVHYRRSVLCCLSFCGQKDSVQRILLKKCFLFTVGSVCRVKRFKTGSGNSLQDVRKSQMMPDHVRKCLRQQPNDFYAVGFDALVKRWDKTTIVGGGYVENFFFSMFEYHMF
jgi:hypothetical protein